MELPRLEAIWNKYKDEGFSLVAIETQLFPSDLKNAREFIDQHGFTFPMLRNGDRMSAEDAALKASVNVEDGLPFNLILDGEGKVMFIHNKFKPGDELKMEEEIQVLLDQ